MYTELIPVRRRQGTQTDRANGQRPAPLTFQRETKRDDTGADRVDRRGRSVSGARRGERAFVPGRQSRERKFIFIVLGSSR